jgi:hypothetical protein
VKEGRTYIIVGVILLLFCAWGAAKHASCAPCQNKAAAIYQRSALRGYNGPEP